MGSSDRHSQAQERKLGTSDGLSPFERVGSAPTSSMLLMDDLVDHLTDAKLFSTVDLKCGYYQMQMREEDAPNTSIMTPDGQYRSISNLLQF